jgi:hypothetical protein
LGRAKVESGQPIIALWSVDKRSYAKKKKRENVQHNIDKSTKALDVMLTIPPGE